MGIIRCNLALLHWRNLWTVTFCYHRIHYIAVGYIKCTLQVGLWFYIKNIVQFLFTMKFFSLVCLGHKENYWQEECGCVPDVQRWTECCQEGADQQSQVSHPLASQVLRTGSVGKAAEETHREGHDGKKTGYLYMCILIMCWYITLWSTSKIQNLCWISCQCSYVLYITLCIHVIVFLCIIRLGCQCQK